MSNLEETRSRIGGIPVEETPGSDNLGIALAAYFEKHLDRPKDDPDDEHGWGVWVMQKTNAALDLIAAELLTDGASAPPTAHCAGQAAAPPEAGPE